MPCDISTLGYISMSPVDVRFNPRPLGPLAGKPPPIRLAPPDRAVAVYSSGSEFFPCDRRSGGMQLLSRGVVCLCVAFRRVLPADCFRPEGSGNYRS